MLWIYLKNCDPFCHLYFYPLKKVMDPGPIIAGITGFLCSFAGVYYCRTRIREFKPNVPDPIVVVHREEEPGDPVNPT